VLIIRLAHNISKMADDFEEARAQVKRLIDTIKQPQTAGIRVIGGSDNKFEGNKSFGYDFGIDAQDSERNEFKDNLAVRGNNSEVLSQLEQLESLLGAKNAEGVRSKVDWFKENAPRVATALCTIAALLRVIQGH
jgi:parallel beta-helix repeat protein